MREGHKGKKKIVSLNTEKPGVMEKNQVNTLILLKM